MESSLDSHAPFVQAMNVLVSHKQRANGIEVRHHSVTPSELGSIIAGVIKQVTESLQPPRRPYIKRLTILLKFPLLEQYSQVPAAQIVAPPHKPRTHSTDENFPRFHPCLVLLPARVGAIRKQVFPMNAVHRQAFRNARDRRQKYD